ncbi:hypothetical protein BAE44_0007250 [Dichanthelium oligosanthes]|uniref:Uncharacterized protein n=1 Tax=Dichanthelium oligosanthes TaxID=888268 RepID=A0A1E5W2Y4_9POAL|nr:hypothetical protein BAE44_0007250 [Dichanthelium oligosanthes]
MRVRGPQRNTDMAGFMSGGHHGTNGTWGGPGWGLSDDGPYILSDEHNEFVLKGCHLFAELLIDDQAINRCVSTCSRGLPTPNDGECFKPETRSNPHCCRCTGITCCQATILISQIAYDWRLRTLHKPEDEPLLVYLLFISEEGWYHPSDNDTDDYLAVPAILKWAVTSDVVPFNESESRDGNATCPRDLGSTTCHSRHSTCTNLYSPLHLFGKYNDSYT